MPENIIVTDLGNGYVRLVASPGYELVIKRNNQVVSEAVVKPENVKDFIARPLPVPEEPVAPKKSGGRKKSS